jgi:TRAP-type C4-dicarboxylate transport system permease large subunit
MTNPDLAAIPLFIFMACMLERAGLIEEMFDVVYKWMGGLNGGLAAATILASTILAAMVGVIGAAVVTMGIIALPAMLKRNYDQQLALGSIMAGGTLGILIPPSILAILYAVVAQQSVGRLYLGCVLPGLLLSALYIAYVLIRTRLNPLLGPAIPKEERVVMAEKMRLLANLIAPMILVFLVLGLLFFGVATPVEAAGVGSFGAIVVSVMHKRFSLTGLREASITTARASAMVLWIIFGASIFVGFFILQGVQGFITESILGTGWAPRHTGRDDATADIPGHVPRLGGHPPAHRADLRANHPVAQLRRPAGTSRSTRSRGDAVVRRAVRRQHADVLPEPALRLRAVLSARRCSARDQHGDHLQIVSRIPGAPGGRAVAVRLDSWPRHLAAAPGVWLMARRHLLPGGPGDHFQDRAGLMLISIASPRHPW